MIRTLAIGILSTFILACEKLPDPVVPDTPREENNEGKENNGNDNSGETDTTMPETIKITVSGKTLPVKIEDNELTLPANNSQITTQPGDVILYSGNQIVLFYGSNTWSYTRIGKMQYGSLDELKSFLKAGEGNISVTLSL